MKSIFMLLLVSILTVPLVRAEIIEMEFVSGGHRFRAEGLSNLKYPFETIEGESLLLITHASKYWDSKEVTWPGIEAMTGHFRRKNLPMKYMVSVQESWSYRTSPENTPFLPPGVRSNDLYPFQGDSHRIIFKGKNIIITGGNFTICACGTTRSAIALSEGKELNVFFVMDGIYEGQLGVTRSLSEISGEMNDTEFIQFLKDSYFNDDSLPCREATFFALDQKFSYRIYRNQKFIGNIGKGGKKIVLHFATSDKVIGALP